MPDLDQPISTDDSKDPQQISRAELLTVVSQLGAKIDDLERDLTEFRKKQEETLSVISKHLYFDALNWNAFSAKFDRSLIENEDRLRDILECLLRTSGPAPAHLTVKTDHPIAEDTPDHMFPRGTALDNTRSPRFVAACEGLFSRPLQHLDIGCAGGGLVWDFTLRGHLSIGIEGSDWSRRAQRAEWRTIPDRLFTADVRYPFRVEDSQGGIQLFNIITAWELFEHIPELALPTLFANLKQHLTPDGIVVASIATFHDADEAGRQFHATVRDKTWWGEAFAREGLALVDSPFAPADYLRGSGNPRAFDWDARAEPSRGFHVVARHAI